MGYEKKTKVPSALYQKRVNNLRDKLEDHRKILRNTCKVVQPTQKGMTQLHYRTVKARDFISEMHDKYSHYMEEKIINTMLNKLEYTLKIASSKLEELEDLDDKTFQTGILVLHNSYILLTTISK